MTRWGQLWGGPMDGERVFLGDGDLPARVGMHRTADGALVPIRSRAMADGQHQHVDVYERVTLDVLKAWRAQVGDTARLFDAAGYQRLEDVPLYVYRDVVTRWLAGSA
jgi:hypothetical protein